jgi:multidrug efflux pump subunit AcrB
VQSANSTIPAGTLYTPERTYAIRDNGRLLDAAAFGTEFLFKSREPRVW